MSQDTMITRDALIAHLKKHGCTQPNPKDLDSWESVNGGTQIAEDQDEFCFEADVEVICQELGIPCMEPPQ